MLKIADTPTGPGLMGRTAQALMEHIRALKANPINLVPGVLGAGIGATAMGLNTSRDPDETPAQRTRRIIRNSLVGGALGGVGGQLTWDGLVQLDKEINGDAKPGDNGNANGYRPPHPFSGIRGRMISGLVGSQSNRTLNWTTQAKRKGFEEAFRMQGVGEVSNADRLPIKTDFGAPASDKFPDRVEHADNTFARLGRKDIVGEQAAQLGRGGRILNGPQPKSLPFSEVSDLLAAKFHRDPAEMLAYLKAHGGGGGVKGDIRKFITDFTGAHQYSKAGRRWAYGRTGARFGAGFFLPDIIRAGANAIWGGATQPDRAVPTLGPIPTTSSDAPGFFTKERDPLSMFSGLWGEAKKAVPQGVVPSARTPAG